MSWYAEWSAGFRIQGISSTGTFDISGARVELTVVDDALYLKTDQAGWQVLGSPAAASLFVDKWVKVPANSAEPEEPFTITTMLDELAQTDVRLEPGVVGPADRCWRSAARHSGNGSRLRQC